MWGLLLLALPHITSQYWADSSSFGASPLSALSFPSALDQPSSNVPFSSSFSFLDNNFVAPPLLSASYPLLPSVIPVSSQFSFVPSFPLTTFQPQRLFSSFQYTPESAQTFTSNPVFPAPRDVDDDIDANENDDDDLEFQDDTFIPLPFGQFGAPSYKPKAKRPKNTRLIGSGQFASQTHYDLRGLSKFPNSDMEPLFPLQYVPPDKVQQPSSTLPTNPSVIAEWEPVQGAILRYPMGVSVELVKEIARELRVYVLCVSDLLLQAKDGFRSAGVNLRNVVFLDIPTDTYWVRDYGAWFIRTSEAGRSVVRIVDVRYKEILTRPNDDRMPALLAVQLNQSTHYGLRTVCQGGNFMTDSMGSAASTTRLIDDNPSMSWDEIQDSFGNVLGVKNYFLVKDPGYPTNYIQHVDCWCKFIGPQKILIKRLPASDPLYAAYETAASLWAARTNSLGEKYIVYRVDGPMESAYLNHVILNDRVFVPVLATPDDDLAVSQIQAAYGPTFRVLPVVAAVGLPWLMSDALHCRLSSIPVLH